MAQGSMTPAPSDGTMVLDDDHGTRTPCPFPGCKEWSHLGTPFCRQHLREVGFTTGKKTAKSAVPPSTARSDDSMESQQRYPTAESSEGADRSMTSERSLLEKSSSSSHRGVAGHRPLTRQSAHAPPEEAGREEAEEDAEEEVEQRKRARPAGEPSQAADTSFGSFLVSSMPQRTSPPLYGGVMDIHELRARRRRPVPPYNLDAYVYNQDGVGMAAPEDVIIPTRADMAASRAKSAANVAAAMTTAAMMTPTTTTTTTPASPFPVQPQYLYANVDPRIHWMRPRSNSWHVAKQAEIRARGGRKANFGKAAQRLARQRRHDQLERQGAGGSGSVAAGARKPGGSNIAHSRAHRSNTGVGKTHGHTSTTSSASSHHEAASASTSSRGPVPSQSASAASSEVPYEMDLPAYVHNNEQWMKFISIFAQQRRDRQMRQTLRHGK